jgi:predicted ribosomally synthesized peptide with SipW-like signal peptide
MLKKTTNRKTIAITVLAVLLVALLAFNVTYAYFTDQTKSDITMTFGVVDIVAQNFAAASATAVMPGDSITLNGTVTAANATGTMWIKIGVLTGADNEAIVLEYDGKALAEGDKNMYMDDAGQADGSGHEYTDEEIEEMKSLVASTLTSAIANVVNSTTGNTGRISADGVSAAEVDNTLSIDFSTATTKLTLAKNSFGNLFQKVTIKFSIAIQAIQAENVSRTQAIEAFAKSDAEFVAGIFTADLA